MVRAMREDNPAHAAIPIVISRSGLRIRDLPARD